MNYFLDSNIFLRFYANEGNKLVIADCANLIDIIRIGKVKAKTSHLVISEVVWTLLSYYKASKEQVVKVINSIGSIPNLKIEDKFKTNVAHQLFEDKNVKYIDTLIASNPEIQTKKMAVISYDKDFDKLGVKRFEPKDLI